MLALFGTQLDGRDQLAKVLIAFQIERDERRPPGEHLQLPRREFAPRLVAQDDDDRFISLRGSARVLQDRATIESLWSEPYKVWFPEGKEDPRIVLINFRPQEGEYWDNRGTKKLEYMFEAVRAYASGERPRVDEGDQHGRIPL